MDAVIKAAVRDELQRQAQSQQQQIQEHAHMQPGNNASTSSNSSTDERQTAQSPGQNLSNRTVSRLSGCLNV